MKIENGKLTDECANCDKVIYIGEVDGYVHWFHLANFSMVCSGQPPRLTPRTAQPKRGNMKIIWDLLRLLPKTSRKTAAIVLDGSSQPFKLKTFYEHDGKEIILGMTSSKEIVTVELSGFDIAGCE